MRSSLVLTLALSVLGVSCSHHSVTKKTTPLSSREPSSLKAAAVGKKAYTMISMNSKLQGSLQKMGFDSIEAAASEFESVASALEAKGFDLNLGTLAICAKMNAAAYKGVNIRPCTTLFHLYSVMASTAGVQAEVSLNLNAIYFRHKGTKPGQANACYYGKYAGGGLELKLGGEALKEIHCDTSKLVRDGGFFVGLEIGYGAAIAFGNQLLSVSIENSYWNDIMDISENH